MFNFNKSREDPQRALENARNAVNQGLTGGLTRAFMGQGQAAIDYVSQMNRVAQNGLEASADVLSVADMGATINMNPLVEMKLHVIPATGAPFEATARTIVSRITVPRKGDRINIKYNPADVSQIFVLP